MCPSATCGAGLVHIAPRAESIEPPPDLHELHVVRPEETCDGSRAKGLR